MELQPELVRIIEVLEHHGFDRVVRSGSRLPAAERFAPSLEPMRERLRSAGSKSLLVVGASGVGKSALLSELARGLLEGDSPQLMVQLSTGDILRGAKYIGEWEERLGQLIAIAKRPAPVVLWISNLNDIVGAGRVEGGNQDVAQLLVPHLESGDIAVVGESTPAALTAGLGAHPNLERLFLRVNLEPTTEAETLVILEGVRERWQQTMPNLDVPSESSERALELSRLLRPVGEQPGRAVDLFDGVLAAASQTGRTDVAPAFVARILAEWTGLPLWLFDDDEPLDLEELQRFFEERVLGQSEAVSTMVDVITLVKAGLQDPSQPLAVLFFVGPTGVGKTEIAKALAERLFGSADRMTRIDMSEFSDWSAPARLIGYGGQPGALTERVRQQPFSVVLLDEIEKAAEPTFDLFLQVFDDGRLTDGRGVTVDFRQTIVVMTSNLGSDRMGRETLGFHESSDGVADDDPLLESVHQFFRPEFVNRIDRVVPFRPLSADALAKIAQREIGKILARSGLTRRRLSVDIDPSVVSLLVRSGTSTRYGARPMKRAVERLVLLPLARRIAVGKAPAGGVLQLRAAGAKVVAELVRDPLDDEVDRLKERFRIPSPLPERRGSLSAAELERWVEELRDKSRAMQLQLEELELTSEKSELVERTQRHDFWDEPTRARRILSRIHALESLVENVQRVSRRVEDLFEWVPRVARSRQRPRLERAVERYRDVARDLEMVEFDLSCGEPIDRLDAFLKVTAVPGRSRTQRDIVAALATMYRNWANTKGFDVFILDDSVTDRGGEDTITLVLEGACAYGLLKAERGLHVIDEIGAPGGKRRLRAYARVEVWPSDDEEVEPERLEAADLPETGSANRGRFGNERRTRMRLFHEASGHGVVARTHLPVERCRELLARLLREIVRDSEDEPSERLIVRRYSLPPEGRVRDTRSGLQTSAVEQVLGGDLDRFLLVP